MIGIRAAVTAEAIAKIFMIQATAALVGSNDNPTIASASRAPKAVLSQTINRWNFIFCRWFDKAVSRVCATIAISRVCASIAKKPASRLETAAGRGFAGADRICAAVIGATDAVPFSEVGAGRSIAGARAFQRRRSAGFGAATGVLLRIGSRFICGAVGGRTSGSGSGTTADLFRLVSSGTGSGASFFGLGEGTTVRVK